VTTGSSGEGEHFRQNPHNRRDVNGDGGVSPSDVLAGINKLNSLASQGIAEGEEHELKLYDIDGNRQMYYDTNGDGHHSPADILSVVNYLNDPINQGIAEGEGGLPVWIAAAPQFGHPDDALLTRNAVPSGNALLAATDQPQRPAAEDEVFQMIGERDHESDSHAEWLDLDDDTGFMTDW
jgi:hypothetical protein